MKKRKSIRLKGYDYSLPGLYFVTICTRNRIHRFGKIANNKMVLNENGKIVEYVWKHLIDHYPSIRLHDYVVMPNHFHGIVQILSVMDMVSPVGEGLKPSPTTTNNSKLFIGEGLKPSPTKPLTEIVRGFKTFSAQKINELHHTIGENVWQRNYYEHIIRTQMSYEHIVNYIRLNPIHWGNDCFNE